jgi:hypothetical protein
MMRNKFKKKSRPILTKGLLIAMKNDSKQVEDLQNRYKNVMGMDKAKKICDRYGCIVVSDIKDGYAKIGNIIERNET